MKIVATLALLQLWISATARVSGSGSTETALSASPGDIVLLPCDTGGQGTPLLTKWLKNGHEINSSSSAPRLTVLQNGSLNIQQVIPEDEGSYLCNATLPGSKSFQAGFQLRVSSGSENVSTSISPATALPNGTLFTSRGSSLTLNCSRSSHPSQQLTWAFRGDSSSNDSLLSGSGSWLDFRIENIQASAQGVYSCMAHNPVSNQTVSKSTELLVYYVSDRHPECLWALTQDPSHIQFTCTWLGVYPTPELRWEDDPFEPAYSLSVMMNRSVLSEGQSVRCAARHLLLGPGKEKSCSLTLKLPYPEGEPMAAVLEADNVTLKCTEAVSTPPANTTWRKGQEQVYIVPGSKYILSEEGPVFMLTIVNVTKDDEGIYFCRSENPLGVRELEVYLTVKRTSSAYTGAVIGIFIAALVVGSTVIVAKTVYNSRHRICLGGFGQVDDEEGDVLSLVESDDEQIFQDAVPQLPPITNGGHTTLVQIHRIPSSDHEDAETADTSPQQLEDAVQTEEPEDLVEF
ncbi:V-set and immunoglobulin domain-containing protein 10 isoform X2 [Archocentrus centrarchus]|uniref:V-set and immunoglobulin domain-containing protein 10 isoform X2 n=1 Tax=Archocentrus centrarchus TaxID=63155 RepID=UPI0011EA4815|nr:V-set and immunoglobulin domain-containing protein 10 isoform X2 [Archocentrus centrarchus]